MMPDTWTRMSVKLVARARAWAKFLPSGLLDGIQLEQRQYWVDLLADARPFLAKRVTKTQSCTSMPASKSFLFVVGFVKSIILILPCRRGRRKPSAWACTGISFSVDLTSSEAVALSMTFERIIISEFELKSVLRPKGRFTLARLSATPVEIDNPCMLIKRC